MYLQSKENAKKTYNSPTLEVYGNIGELTQNNSVLQQNSDNHSVAPSASNKTGYNM
ncbi:hypothetical protein PMG71_20680 [Roseofilum sp. BLCC_M154]|uniref:Lasso peptide n=1 Tax=Roseofilum acuticapitatum BLCC-M154 TaxID=3022444 RepID=A0ABT7B0M1_9CYAN|nr:hypothetical protein [Roseofilum acuticapitatum]MDJ1171848.1 hypothetical protein [Roseofilum acuticapitatum BLCC-M154]